MGVEEQFVHSISSCSSTTRGGGVEQLLCSIRAIFMSVRAVCTLYQLR